MSAENPPQPPEPNEDIANQLIELKKSQDGIVEAQNLKDKAQVRLDAALERHENLDETLRNDEVKLLSDLLIHFEDQTKAAEVRNRLQEHAEAMHVIAQEENGIENPTSLKEHLDSLEPAKSENDPAHKESVEHGPEKGKEGEPNKDHEKKDKHDKHEAHAKHGKHDKHEHTHAHHESKPITKRQQRAGTAIVMGGLTALGAGVVWGEAPFLAAKFGLSPVVTTALAQIGVGGGLFAAGLGATFMFIFARELIGNLYTEGMAWAKKASVGGLSFGSGGGGKKAKGGGGGHAPAGGDHGGGH